MLAKQHRWHALLALRRQRAPVPHLAPLAILASGTAAPADQAPLPDMLTWLADSAVTLDQAQLGALAMATALTHAMAGQAVAALLGAPAPTLHLLPLLPAGWDLAQRTAGALWLQQTAALAHWPAERMALAARLPADARGATPCAVLGRLACHVLLSGQPVAGLLIAADPQGAAAVLVCDLQQANAACGHVILTLQADANGTDNGTDDGIVHLCCSDDGVPFMTALVHAHRKATALNASMLHVSHAAPLRPGASHS
jgi:hypothetical protein